MAALSDDDGALDGWVPSLDHATLADWDAVYEPAEDTFLLLDALFGDRARLRAASPRLVVEVGPGSGVVAAYAARLLAAARPAVVAVDVNAKACGLAARTARANGAEVDVVRGDLDASLSVRVRPPPGVAF